MTEEQCQAVMAELRAIADRTVRRLRAGRMEAAAEGLQDLLTVYAAVVRFNADQATAALRDLDRLLRAPAEVRCAGAAD